MDAGTILYHSAQGFGTNLVQLEKELQQLGRVVRLKEKKEEDLPAALRGYDYLIDRSNFLATRYIAVKLTDAGAGRYAIELLASPHKTNNKVTASLKKKYAE